MRLWGLLFWMLSGLAAQAQDAVRLGVFGTVDGTEPLSVAGRQIAVPEGIAVISPLGAGQALALGDTVAIAVTATDGGLRATRILEIYPLVGPVTSSSGDTAVIMGSTIHLPPDTAVKNGRWVAVSGLWSGNTVITTKLRAVDGGGFGQLTGVVDPLGLQVGTSAVRDVQIPTGGFGDDVWMFAGAPREDGLGVRLMSQGLFGGEVDLTLWQGYASAPVASQTYMIHGTGITGTARDAQMPAAGELVVACAREGRVVRAPPEEHIAAFNTLDCPQDTPEE